MVRGAGWAVAAVVLAAATVAGCTSSNAGSGTGAGPRSTAMSSGASPSSGSPSATTSPVTAPRGAGSSSARSSTTAAAGPAGGPVPARFVPVSATFVSSTHGWALGRAPCPAEPCTSVLRTRDGGRTWTGIPAPRVSTGIVGSSQTGAASVLRFADDQDGWAGVGELYSTHDGGRNWHAQHLGPRRSEVQAVETGGGRVYAVVYGCPSQGGSYCSRTSRVFSSPVHSDDWTAVSRTLPGGGIPNDLVVHGPDWFLGTQAAVYHGTGTKAPNVLPNPCPYEGRSRGSPVLAAADARHLDAMCLLDGAAGSARYQLYGTGDGGRAWRRSGPSHLEHSGLYGIADNGAGVLLVATASGDSRILRTTDDGGHYTDASATTPGGGIGWSDLGFTTADRAVAVLQGTALYLSHDAGRSFSRVRF